MQKINKKASILLWAVMLSLIVAITFISISTKINKNIKLSGQLNKFNEEKNYINLLIQSGSNQSIDSNKIIIFDDNKEKFFSLKKGEIKEFSFSGTSDFNIDIGIINGGVLNYKYLDNNNIITSSGIINYSKSFTGELNNNTGSLIFENFGGYTTFLIKSENSFDVSDKKYKIVTKIGNNFLNETKGNIK